MKVLLAGGGTAGHTSPLIATADALRRLAPDTEVLCLGTARGLETRVVPEAGYRLELIPPVPLPRRLSRELFKLPANLRAAIRATESVLDSFEPDVVVGYGGYVSMPAYVAAKRRGLPLVVHEQNALPGLANKVGSRIASKQGRVAVSFPSTDLPSAEYVGLPIRRMISTLDRAGLKAEALAEFGLESGRPTLVVTGGSQGARRLNESVVAAWPALEAAGFQVLHVIGPKNELASPGPGYVVRGYVDRMDLALAAADVMICRSGASSVVEAAAVGIPAIFVPLPHGNGEQEFNARPVAEAGGALVVADGDLSPEWIAVTLSELIADPQRLITMGERAMALVPRDADERLARIILEVGA